MAVAVIVKGVQAAAEEERNIEVNACVIRHIFSFSFFFALFYHHFFFFCSVANNVLNTHTDIQFLMTPPHLHTKQRHSADPTKASSPSLLNVPAILALLLA